MFSIKFGSVTSATLKDPFVSSASLEISLHFSYQMYFVESFNNFAKELPTAPVDPNIKIFPT